jgi:hypothetical protein
MRVVRDGGDQGWVHHRRAETKEDAPPQPPPEAPFRHGEEDPPSLHPHPYNDQALSTPPVAEGAGEYLKAPPHRRVDGLEHPDALHP